MSRAQITRIVPVSAQILFLVFKDTQSEKYDAKFMLHHIPGINPRLEPEHFKAFLFDNKHIVSEWERNIKFNTPDLSGESVEVTLSFPEDELAEIESSCTDMNISVEQFALALAHFFVEPGADKALAQWYAELNTREEVPPQSDPQMQHP